MATEVLDQKQLGRLGWHSRHRLILDAGLNYWYMQLRSNGQFLMGNAMHVPAPTDGVTIPPHDDQEAFGEIHREMLRRFPWMEDVGIDCAWGGPLGMTESGFPLTCAVDDGLYVNAAYNGKGVLMATLSGRVLGPEITGSAPDPDYQRYAALLLRSNADKVELDLAAVG
jgi:glycine/D-amino acid oxidase-like deaminating enzyme